MKSNTKTRMVADCLRDRIEMRYYPEGRLPREFDLAAELNVGRVTVRKALEALEQDDLIERKKHAGTFVKLAEPPTLNQQTVGIMMRTQGHLYADFHHYIIRHLMDRGLTANVISLSDIEKSVSPSLTRAVSKLVNSEIKGLIYEPYCTWKIPFGPQLEKKIPVFTGFYDSENAPAFTGVWNDYEKAGYLGGKFLLECGCRKPLLITHPLPPEIRWNAPHYARHREKMIIDGYSRALKEYGMIPEAYILEAFRDDPDHMKRMVETLMRDHKLRPDGMLGSSDSLLLHPLKIAYKLNIQIHQNLQLVGIGNTPWSKEDSLQPFSSIDLQLVTCAKKLVEQICLKAPERENIYIEPKLIRRNQL